MFHKGLQIILVGVFIPLNVIHTDLIHLKPDLMHDE